MNNNCIKDFLYTKGIYLTQDIKMVEHITISTFRPQDDYDIMDITFGTGNNEIGEEFSARLKVNDNIFQTFVMKDDFVYGMDYQMARDLSEEWKTFQKEWEDRFSY